MKFVSKYDGIDYIIRPSQLSNDVHGIPMPPTPPIHAKFQNHYFDTEVAEEKENWKVLSLAETDGEDPHAIRKAVERRLQSHGDFGNGLYVAGEEPANATLTREELEKQSGCVAATLGPNNTTILCRRQPTVREGLCIEHAAMFLGFNTNDPEPEPSPEDSEEEVASSVG